LDQEFKLEEKPANNASSSCGLFYGVDTNWCTDTGAIDHIMSELDKISTKEIYTGQEKIQTANGSGMRISYVGNSTLQTPTCNLHLNNILHVPRTQKNLLSVHSLTIDNPIFIKYHSCYFLVKDRAMRKVLL
jgi:hypothetical protein